MSETDLCCVNIQTPQVSCHQLQGVKFVIPHIPLLHMETPKKKQPSGKSAFPGEAPGIQECSIRENSQETWSVLESPVQLDVCQFLFKQNV